MLPSAFAKGSQFLIFAAFRLLVTCDPDVSPTPDFTPRHTYTLVTGVTLEALDFIHPREDLSTTMDMLTYTPHFRLNGMLI